MEWIVANWLILLLVGCCVGMMFMHKKHGNSNDDNDNHKH